MKKVIFLSFATLIMLASCSSDKTAISIVKRKYTKGYYVDFCNKSKLNGSNNKEVKATNKTEDIQNDLQPTSNPEKATTLFASNTTNKTDIVKTILYKKYKPSIPLVLDKNIEDVKKISNTNRNINLQSQL